MASIVSTPDLVSTNILDIVFVDDFSDNKATIYSTQFWIISNTMDYGLKSLPDPSVDVDK